MLNQIKNIKKDIEYLQNLFKLASANERHSIMLEIISNQNMLDKLEDAYYYGK